MLLNRHNLNVARFASTDTARQAICRVNVTPKYTEATNGHYIVRTALPSADPADFPEVPGHTNGSTAESTLVPAETLKAVAKALPKAKVTRRHPILENASLDPATRSIATTDLESPSVRTFPEPEPEPDGVLFPNTDRIIPTDKPLHRVTLDAKYLRDLCDYLTAASDPVTNRITVEFRGELRPVVIRSATPEGQDVLAMLMPILVRD